MIQKVIGTGKLRVGLKRGTGNVEMGNKEMWKRRNDRGLPCSRHVLSPGTVSDLFICL